MKNLLTQWDTKEENRKILSVFDKKPLNPDGNGGGKPKTDEVGWWKFDPTGSMKNFPT